MKRPVPNLGFVRCPQCARSLSGDLYDRTDDVHCPRCDAQIRIEVFPALYREPVRNRAGEPLDEEGQAGCFYHPQKKAIIPCGGCGRFLCALCDVELAGRHLCPACIETFRTRGSWAPLIVKRTLYDRAALYLALLPVLLFFLVVPVFLSVFTAPMAIYLALRHWRTPTSLLPRTRLRFAAAILLAGLQLAGWAVFFVKIL